MSRIAKRLKRPAHMAKHATRKAAHSARTGSPRTVNSLRNHRTRTTVFVTLSIIVVLLVVAALRMRALAHTHEVRVLDCPVASGVGHFHDESCYDDEGDLVCSLEEVGLHFHDELCYDEEGELVCDLAEGGEEHVHGPGCFKTMLVDSEGNPVDTQADSAETPNTGTETEAKAEKVHYKADLREVDEDGEERVVVTVEADVPADALPEDAKLYVDRLREKSHEDELTAEEELEVDPAELDGAEGAAEDEGKAEGKPEEAKADETKKDDTGAGETKTDEATGDAKDSDATSEEAKDDNAKEDEAKAALVEDASEKAVEKVEDEAEGKVMGLLALDISFRDSAGKKVEPAETVALRVSSDVFGEGDDPYVVRFDDKGEAQLAKPFTSEELESLRIEERPDELVFESQKLEPCAVVVASTDQQLEADGGETYETMHVAAPAAAGVPSGSELRVSEIGEGSDEYADYVQQLIDTLGEEASQPLVYDITIARGSYEVQPQEAVGVSITLDAGVAERFDDVRIVHFGAEGPEEIAGAKEGQVVSFEATGFSAYAIVPAPEPTTSSWEEITSIDDVVALGANGLYIGSNVGNNNQVNGTHFFFTGTLYTATGQRRGIQKTKPATTTPPSAAVKYYFERIGDTDQFYMYCLGDGDDGTERKYVCNNVNGIAVENGLGFTDRSHATAFTMTASPDGFRLNNGNYYVNMQGNANGNGFCAFNQALDVNNYLRFFRKTGIETDPYDLNGKSFGLMRWDGAAMGKALMSDSSNANCLDARVLTVMTYKDNDEDKLFVPNDSGITMWTFEWIEDDTYYLKADVNGATKYLSITDSGLSLQDSSANCTPIKVTPGTGSHAGEITLSAGGTTLTYTGDKNLGFKVGGDAGTEWLHMVTESELTDDYFKTFTARKVSVSDPSVTTNSKLVVYTRIWNGTKQRYDFYAINHDGTLLRCYESGDQIQWVGSQVNTLLWEFTEYFDEATDSPTYYYELYNQYAEKFLAPLYSDGQILSDEPIGLNLNGRREGKYYTPIVAWDDGSYAYSGIKADDASEHIVACPNTEAIDFYFAIVEEKQNDEMLTTVSTVDNNQHGITMRIRNFGTRADMTEMMGTNNEWTGDSNKDHKKDLLSRELGPDGYPVATNGNHHSLGEYYADAATVNHLFIESIYGSTGYYVYDSSQNFASLQANGDFKVYKELGTYDQSSKPTLKHGQFFPFNDIEAGQFASVNGKNEYKVDATPLDDDDPRKNEKLYLLKDSNGRFGNADCYFAVELEASFVQTPSGLDDWGHDIIYEFTGDDDFWLYVDGQLVIDLGGIHSAMPGSVNFATGDVVVNGKPTTLRALFADNYEKKYPNATPEEVEAYLNGIFKDGQSVFKDNTTHTMKIFYMERGGGASNLNMRFNLASIRPGTVLLSKELDGVDKGESVSAEYPYQIFYKTEDEPDVWKQVDNVSPEVVYKETSKKVSYRPSLTVGGTTYEKVFMLKPDEVAEIQLPDNATTYKVVECGVNTDVYDHVYMGNDELTGTDRLESYKDFEVIKDDPKTNAVVAYKNHVNEDALRTLTFTKSLFQADGVTPITYSDDDGDDSNNDQTEFNFRLYFGSEFDEDVALVNMHTYHVKDPEGYYCAWNSSAGRFERLIVESTQSGETDFDALSDDDKQRASFTTSMYGAIARIPNGFTVEMRAVLVGTRYEVEERSDELPDGYGLQGYRLNHAEDADHNPVYQSAPITGSVQENEDPNIEVRNLKGYGLRVNKTWVDQSYMSDREPTYFAVFINRGDNAEPELVDGSIRRMDFSQDTLYWYYQMLPDTSVPFDKYLIYEVSLVRPVVDENGVVTSYSSMNHVIEPEQQHHIHGSSNQLQLEGTQKGASGRSHLKYTVEYERGTIQEGSNVRVDEVTNKRPGVVIRKVDWDGNPLRGATFALNDEGNTRIGTFTSDQNGDVTIAFLRPQVTYTLEEIKAPQGYYGMPGTMTIVQRPNGTVDVGGVDTQWFVRDQTPGAHGHRTLMIKDRKTTLEVIKVDRDTRRPLSGVEFSLYKVVVVDGVTTTRLLEGYESLVTGANGVVPGIDVSLPPATYELREEAAQPGYKELRPHLRFTISDTGVVSLVQQPAGTELDETVQNDTVAFTITVPNAMTSKVVMFKKVDIAAVDTALPGATFDLYEVDDNGHKKADPSVGITGLTSNSEGILHDTLGSESFGLPIGTYHLVETAPPDGYVLKEPVVIVVTAGAGLDGMSYDDHSTLSSNGGLTFDNATNTYTMKISNSAGTELPASGGEGTTGLYAVGAVLVAAGALHFARQRRSEC